MFAAVSVTGSAQVVVNPDTFPDFFTGDVNECYFASVSNGEDFGLGASQTSITVQNLSGEEGVAYILVGTGDGYDEATFAALQPGASKTFTGADLGIADGTTAPVAVLGYDFASSQAGEFTPEDGITIGCVAKQAVAGASLPYTTASDTSVSGYNATSGRETGFFDELYLPIVQTNCGPGGCWNTILRVSNVGPFDNAAVTVRFFPAENAAGSLDTGFQLEGLLNQGELWSIDLSEWVPEGWVGSAHIFTDDAVVAIADRYKAGTDMWITNTAANKTAESDLQAQLGISNAPYALFAPDIRLDYNGWNTGISVANTVDDDNNVNIQYFGNNGNAPQGQAARIAAHGMTYLYNPSDPSEDECEQPADQVPTCDFVGAAIVLSEWPVAVAVDGVKYFGNDANVGQAFSYSATGNVHNWQAAPLVQKGSPATGMGATSGITFLNPNAFATFITVDWVNPSGFGASNFGDSIVWVPGFTTGFVYTMTQENLPNGFSGSAIVSSDLPIAATSANVDYQVQGDGTAIWTLYNPCGFYRQLGDCAFIVEPEEQATKTFDIRPAGVDALICVFDSVTGQDGKPIPPTEECVLEDVFVKGGDGGEQDDVQTFVAGGFLLTVDDDDNTIEIDGLADGSVAELGVLTELDDAGNTVPSGDNATCADAADPSLMTFEIGGQLTADAFGLLSANFENTILIVDGVCVDGIQEGTLRPETPEEAQERLGTVVPPFTVDAAGQASVDLAAGCYFFVVSAEGFETFISIEECLEPGEVLDNIIDLAAIGSDTGFLEKTFVDALTGDPLSNLDVVVTPAGSDVEIELGSPNSAGFIRTELSEGDYTLCWDDLSGIVPGDLASFDDDPVFLDGCEDFTIVADETTVLTNELTALSVADQCVTSSILLALGFPVEGIQVTIVDADTLAVVGVAHTDADGEIKTYLEPGFYYFTAEGGLYIDPATGDSIALEDQTVLEEIAAGDPIEDPTCDVEIDLSAQLIFGEAAFFTKTVTADGVPVDGLTVGLFGTTTNSAGDTICNTDVEIGFGVTGFDGDAGAVTFTVEGDQNYCIGIMDVAGNAIVEGEVHLVPVGESTLNNEIGGVDTLVGSLEVTATLDCADAGGCTDETYDVALHLASDTDTATSCNGAFLTSVTGIADGDSASFVLAGGATEYCVVGTGPFNGAVAVGAPGTPDAETDLTVAAGATTAVALELAEV